MESLPAQVRPACLLDASGCLQVPLDASWMTRDASWMHLEASWIPPECLQVPPGYFLVPPGCLQGASWEQFW